MLVLLLVRLLPTMCFARGGGGGGGLCKPECLCRRGLATHLSALGCSVCVLASLQLLINSSPFSLPMSFPPASSHSEESSPILSHKDPALASSLASPQASLPPLLLPPAHHLPFISRGMFLKLKSDPVPSLLNLGSPLPSGRAPGSTTWHSGLFSISFPELCHLCPISVTASASILPPKPDPQGPLGQPPPSISFQVPRRIRFSSTNLSPAWPCCPPHGLTLVQPHLLPPGPLL